MFTETVLSCPLCGNSGAYVHSFKTQPTFGGCERCGYLPVLGYSPRSQIEHRRPKTIPHWEHYDPEREA